MLIAYSPEFVSLAESGCFDGELLDHAENVPAYAKSITCAANQTMNEELPDKRLQPANKTFQQIRTYLEQSKEINEKQLGDGQRSSYNQQKHTSACNSTGLWSIGGTCSRS